MSTQINLKVNSETYFQLKEKSKTLGYLSVQEYIRNLIIQDLKNNEYNKGIYTAIASEKSLAKNWLDPREEKAWKHLQKEIQITSQKK